jgi:hypothetical protein
MAEEGEKLGQKEKFTRRQFIGRTLITGAVIGSGYIPSSTTPVTKVATTFKNLNVLTPHAKAYRSFLRGIRATLLFDKAGTYGKSQAKSLITRTDWGETKSSARLAFEGATRKPDKLVTYHKGGVKLTPKQARASAASTRNVAYQIAPDPKSKAPPSQSTKAIWARQTDRIAKNITKAARTELTYELRKQRKANPDRMFKKKSARIHSENMKTKSKGGRVGGGGKMALPGLQSALNPTGLSLVTQRYTL